MYILEIIAVSIVALVVYFVLGALLIYLIDQSHDPEDRLPSHGIGAAMTAIWPIMLFAFVIHLIGRYATHAYRILSSLFEKLLKQKPEV